MSRVKKITGLRKVTPQTFKNVIVSSRARSLSPEARRKLRNINPGLRKPLTDEVVRGLENAFKKIRALEKRIRRLESESEQATDRPMTC